MSSFLTLLFGTQLDRAAAWTAVAALVTLTGVLVAWRQLTKIRATSQADFTFRFIESFFTLETRVIFTLLDSFALSFDVVEIYDEGQRICRVPYLKINENMVRPLSGLVSIPAGKTGYYAQEVDDLLLGHFESLGWYVRKKLISFESAYQTFAYYVMKAHEHPEIQRYLADPDNKNIYEDFPWIYEQFRRHAKRQER